MKKIYNKYVQLRSPAICIFLLCVAGVLNAVNGDNTIALVELVCAVALLIYAMCAAKIRMRDMQKFMSMMTEQNGNMANEALSRFPLPMLVLNADGKIIWFNQKSCDILNENDLFNVSLPQVMPQIKWTEILKTTDAINMDLEFGDRRYNVLGSLIKRKNEKDEENTYSVLLYFDDITENINIKKTRENEKVDIAIITIDNYDDVFQAMEDAKSRETSGRINTIISEWVNESNGIMKKTDSDRYMVFFEHQYLENYMKKKFDILEKIRAVGDEIKEPITVSIGIGTGGHLAENEAYARNSVEMVWGRGGDQVAVKSEGQFKFYGGASKDYEKSTRVKTRMFSTTLREMIVHADKVIFMGHSSADYDCFGAAVGLSRAAKLLGKKSYIVLDSSPAISTLYEEMQKMPEYQGMIVNPNSALELVEKETLVIVLDTHRPSMLPVPELLNRASKIVLIDHHRRSTEFLDNVSLSYLEPYASSTCEMVTEILQYIDDKKKMNAFEAKALFVGILMDTKNFVTKTGVRTFEAASYLKRYGVNTMEVKKLFNLNFDEYIKRMDIIKRAEIWNTDIAVSVCPESYHNMRVVSSQAADEMLNISGIQAAFVIYLADNGTVAFSARSFGNINVQIIMEKLGGGGHMTVAGCQIRGITPQEAREHLKDAIKEYIEENK